ncbi:uncharacterized protein VP01_912g3, partial [Puccinia sorghi]
MVEKTEGSSRKNIPLLNNSNYATWSIRIKAYLRSKKLINYVINPPDSTLTGAALAAVADKEAETVDILMKYLS